MRRRKSIFQFTGDKTGLFFVLYVIFSVLLTIFGIWSIVEFLLYLVKDNPFNWTVLYVAIGAFVGQMVSALKMVFS